MKVKLIVTIGILVFLFGSITSVIGFSEELTANYQISQNTNGVVLIDDIHNNDYASGDLGSLAADLESMGYAAFFASEFTDMNEGLQYANYLIMTAPYLDISTSDISSIVSWAESGTRGILLASRGDFASVSFSSMNDMLSQLGADTRVQDDNVYSTNTGTSSAWSTRSSNIQNTVAELVTNVNQVAMFSPSSLRFISSTADVIIYGDNDEYQEDINTPSPTTIYDNTADGVGGTSIPLVSHELINAGTTVDKLVITGTTMWSNFDYPNNLDNIVFVRNIVNTFKDHIINIDGSVSVALPIIGPKIKISSPRADSVVKGTVTISAEITDRVVIDSVGIYVDDMLKSSSNMYIWDTTQETFGEHVIKVVATNINAISSTYTQTVTVNQNYVPVVNPIGKVMEYNILLGGENPEWIDVMKEENADIVILVETGGWDDNNNAILNTNLNLLNNYFEDQVNYQGELDLNEGATSGVAILSRYPINSAVELTSVILDDGSLWTPSHDFLHVNIQIGDEEVAIIGGHGKCCSGTDNELKREKAQEGIINYMDSLGDIPIIYAADMNSGYPGEGLNLGSEPIDMLINPSNQYSSTVHTFTDVHTVLNPGIEADTYITGSRIDFIFVNQHLVDLLISSTTADTESGKLGSDHFTVDATLDFRTFLGIPTVSDTTTITSKEADSSLRIELFVLPVIFLIIIRLKKQFKK